MGKIYKNIEELIGHTPLVQLCNLERRTGCRPGSWSNWNI